MRCLAVLVILAALATPRAAQLLAIPVADAAQPGVPPDHDSVSTVPIVPRIGKAGGTPSPTSGIGSPLQGVQGLATWYDSGPGIYAAAGPALRVGHWLGRVVTVCAPGACIRARLSDFCACGHGRVIDLSRQAFRRLAPLSQGVVGVTVSWGGEPPATDTDG